MNPGRWAHLLLCAALVPGLWAAPEGGVSFNRDIRPILSKNCFACHGPDEGSRQGNLRLDRRDDATGANGGHAGIVPGESAESRVVARITHDTLPMPPQGAGERLSGEQVELIDRLRRADARDRYHPGRLLEQPDGSRRLRHADLQHHGQRALHRRRLGNVEPRLHG